MNLRPALEGRIGGYVTALYHDLFSRAADPAGAANWMQFLDTDRSRTRFVVGMITSGEYAQVIRARVSHTGTVEELEKKMASLGEVALAADGADNRCRVNLFRREHSGAAWPKHSVPGLVSLAVAHAELEDLDLRESAVTDSGLFFLRKLQNLKRLELRGASVTEQGVSRLARLLPECEILR